MISNGNSSGSFFDFKIGIYFQLDKGDLDAPQYYPYPTSDYQGARTMDIGDLNNDSLSDIVVGFSDSLKVFWQNPNSIGAFDSSSIVYSGTDVDALKIDDINNDGLKDIVVTHFNETYLRIFYQTNTGLALHNSLYSFVLLTSFVSSLCSVETKETKFKKPGLPRFANTFKIKQKCEQQIMLQPSLGFSSLCS